MGSAKSKENYNLVCVAHPDDETIFFGGLLQTKRNRLPWKVICVTSDGNLKRKADFEKACHALKVKSIEWWSFEDVFEKRLNIDLLVKRLQNLPMPKEVFTHSPMGEYGHPHHQDVSQAVLRAFSKSKVFCVAYNLLPDLVIRLDEKQFEKKAKVLTEIYQSETARFLNVLPVTWAEGFVRIDLEESKKIYEYLAQNKDVLPKLKSHRHLSKYLPFLKRLKRPF